MQLNARSSFYSLAIILILSGVTCLSACDSTDKFEEREAEWVRDFLDDKLSKRVRYLYFTNYQLFYDSDSLRYIYWDTTNWITTKHLPPTYNMLDLWDSPFKELKYVGDKPYYSDEIKIGPLPKKMAIDSVIL